MPWPTVAPIWTATPSRPALPPVRWVSQVPPKMRGISFRGMTSSSPRPAAKTRPMPLPQGPPQRR